MSHAHPTTTDAEGTVTIVGRDRRAVRPSDLRRLRQVERVCTVACASGERTTARFTGVPVAQLLTTVDADPETTHLQLEARDGYRVCVPIRDALDGLVAYARDGEPLGADCPYETRFVAPDVDGERLVKGLAEITALTLDPEDDPDRLEHVTLEAPTFG